MIMHRVKESDSHTYGSGASHSFLASTGLLKHMVIELFYFVPLAEKWEEQKIIPEQIVDSSPD